MSTGLPLLLSRPSSKENPARDLVAAFSLRRSFLAEDTFSSSN